MLANFIGWLLKPKPAEPVNPYRASLLELQKIAQPGVVINSYESALIQQLVKERLHQLGDCDTPDDFSAWIKAKQHKNEWSYAYDRMTDRYSYAGYGTYGHSFPSFASVKSQTSRSEAEIYKHSDY